MLRDFQIFLGPARLRLLLLLLGLTGLLSLMLNAVDAPWVTGVQTGLLLAFIVGMALIIGSRLGTEARKRWLAILAPVIGATILSLTVASDFALPLMGAALGWVAAGTVLLRPRVPKPFQQAIRHMRRGQYEDAVREMDTLIKQDGDNPDNYRLRAEIFRLWGKLDRARRDYSTITELDPDSAVGFNGLAEVHLQAGDYGPARDAGLRALELAPDTWVTAYNLGMIEDRLQDAAAAIEHLQLALQQHVPDARHRLLIHLYLARAYKRSGDGQAAQAQIDLLKRQRAGLEEWQALLKHEEAAPLRAVLEADVDLARDLVDGSRGVDQL